MAEQIISEEFRKMQKLAGIINEAVDTPQWSNAIRNFITTNLSNDEKELYLVIKALEKTLESFKNEMGEYDPDFHYDI
jgi:hypothetical protein